MLTSPQRLYFANWFFCFSVFLTNVLFAQKTEIEIKKTDKHLFDLSRYKPEPKDRVIFEFVHCGWLNMPEGVEYEWHSRGANILLYFDYPLGKSNFSLAWGGGMSWHNLSGNMNFSYGIDSLGYIQTFVTPLETPFRKNIVGAKTLEIPFDIRFRTRKVRSLKITIGGKVGYTVQNFRKIFDEQGKRKYFDVTNYNPIRYGLNFRIGYEQFYLCGFYAFSTIFKEGHGTAQLTPYTIGFGFSPW